MVCDWYGCCIFTGVRSTCGNYCLRTVPTRGVCVPVCTVLDYDISDYTTYVSTQQQRLIGTRLNQPERYLRESCCVTLVPTKLPTCTEDCCVVFS